MLACLLACFLTTYTVMCCMLYACMLYADTDADAEELKPNFHFLHIHWKRGGSQCY
jgi:hypothetical protein